MNPPPEIMFTSKSNALLNGRSFFSDGQKEIKILFLTFYPLKHLKIGWTFCGV